MTPKPYEKFALILDDLGKKKVQVTGVSGNALEIKLGK